MRVSLEPWQFDDLPLDLGQPVWLNHNLFRYRPISGFISGAYFDGNNDINEKGFLDCNLTYEIVPLRSEKFNIGKLSIIIISCWYCN